MSIKAIAPLEKKPEVSPKAEPAESSAESFNTSQTPLSAEALLTLIATMQQQLVESQKQATKANEALAAAIIESGRPKEPIKSKEQLAKEQNDEMFYKQAKELSKRQRETTKLEQEMCDHIAGSRGETKDVHQRTSIVWHRNDAQVDIGICTGCGRIFHPEDPVDSQGHNYSYWRRKGSFNRVSTAGARQFLDPLKAQHDSFLRDS